MGINIEEAVVPEADVGGERDQNNQDTYEECDDNNNTLVQL